MSITVTSAISIELISGIALANEPGNLTTSQAQKLKALGIKIAVPSYIPPGFNVIKLTTEPCPPNARRGKTGVCDDLHPSYQILYRNSQQTCFDVTAVGGGLGGDDGDFMLPVDTKLLGKVNLELGTDMGPGKRPTPQQLNTVQSNIWTYPKGVNRGSPPYSPYYAISTVENQNGCGKNLNLTPLDMKAIIQSLTWL